MNGVKDFQYRISLAFDDILKKTLIAKKEKRPVGGSIRSTHLKQIKKHVYVPLRSSSWRRRKAIHVCVYLGRLPDNPSGKRSDGFNRPLSISAFCMQDAMLFVLTFSTIYQRVSSRRRLKWSFRWIFLCNRRLFHLGEWIKTCRKQKLGQLCRRDVTQDGYKLTFPSIYIVLTGV